MKHTFKMNNLDIKRLVIISLVVGFCSGAVAQTWSQQTACPGWNNPTSFTQGDANNYYRGQLGTPSSSMQYNVFTGETGINWTTAYTAAQMATVANDGSNCGTGIPNPNNMFTIISDVSGYDPNTDRHLKYVPTQFNTLDTTGREVNINLTRSIRIGDGCTSNGSYGAAALYYHVMPRPSNAIMILWYAIVAQQPDHGPLNDPTFVIRVCRQNANREWVQITDTLSYMMSVTPRSSSYSDGFDLEASYTQQGWHRIGSGYNNVVYKDWSKVMINLSNYLYENLRIEVMISDCAYNAHWAYAYIAGECRPMMLTAWDCPANNNACVTSLQAPRDMVNYEWAASEYGVAEPVITLNPGGNNEYFTFRTVGSGVNTYSVQGDDFRVIYRPNSDHQQILVTDSMGNHQTFRCRVTTALDPAKPYTSDMYINLTRNGYLLTAAPNDTTLGSVTGSGLYNSGDAVTITAVPKAHSYFVQWGDGNTDNPRNIVVTSDTTLTAMFSAEHFTITVQSDNSAWGSVSGSGEYAYGTVANIAATPRNGYRFVRWNDGDTRIVRPLTVTQDTSFTAIFDTLPASGYGHFIPDGPNCPGQSNSTFGYEVSGYAEGQLIQSPEDILSVCINMEHSFLGDLQISLLCPSYSSTDTTGHGKAVLKYKNSPSSNIQIPQGTIGGGGHYLGIPYGGPNDSGYDKMNGGNYCDPIYNPYGVGFDYCFSRNSTRTLVNGEPANTPMPENAGIASNGNIRQVTYTFPPIPDGFSAAGQTCGTVSVNSTMASNREAGTDFYVPASDFTSLVGCPINGEWKVEITDYMGVDNGWLFNWDIAFDSTSIAQNTVAVDTTTATYDIRTCTGQTLLFIVENATHTATVIGYVGQCEGGLTVPAWFSVDDVRYTVTAIGPRAFQNCTGLTEVTLPVTITLVDQEAFKGCSGLLKVDMK